MERKRRFNVFVLMPFGKPWDNLYKLVLKPLQKHLPVAVDRADELPFTRSPIYDRIMEAIAKADVIIADLSGRNPNVFYELGYAHALQKNVVPISRDELPFDVRGFFTIRYDPDDLQSLEKKVKTLLKQALTLTNEPGSRKDESSLWEPHDRDIAAIRQFFLAHTRRGVTRRSEGRFTEGEIVRATKIDPKLAYPALRILDKRGEVRCVNEGGNPRWEATEVFTKAAYPLDGYRIVAQKAAYTFLARHGVGERSKSEARSRSLEAVTTKYPDAAQNPNVPMAGILDQALADALHELSYSDRRVRMDE
jgi:nucleoside 2-deoxyribosyltransferase